MAQTQRIARSYLTDLFDTPALGFDVDSAEQLALLVMGEAASVDYQPRRDRLVITFDLAEKPAEPAPAESDPVEL